MTGLLILLSVASAAARAQAPPSDECTLVRAKQPRPAPKESTTLPLADGVTLLLAADWRDPTKVDSVNQQQGPLYALKLLASAPDPQKWETPESLQLKAYNALAVPDKQAPRALWIAAAMGVPADGKPPKKGHPLPPAILSLVDILAKANTFPASDDLFKGELLACSGSLLKQWSTGVHFAPSDLALIDSLFQVGGSSKYERPVSLAGRARIRIDTTPNVR